MSHQLYHLIASAKVAHFSETAKLLELFFQENAFFHDFPRIPGADGRTFGPDIGGFVADVLDEYEAEALLMALRRIGGWVILGTYPTVDNIKLDESGRFASCSVIGCLQHTILVWGRTYKQAVARAVRQRRRYFRSKVEKAREAAGYGRA